jgi:predicted amidohydrolase YtcJ
MRFAALVSVLGAACGARAMPSSSAADILFINGRVHTMENGEPPAQALAVRGERISFVGKNEDALRLRGPVTRVIDLDGQMLLPGFHDSHVHPVTGGIEMGECDLNGATTVADLKQRVLEYARAHPDKPWIVGGGWDLTLFENGNPTRQLLDEWVKDRPVALSAADGHSSWVNSRALELSGFNRQTPDPKGGRIERDARGYPSGTLRESAKGLIAVPGNTAEEYLAGLLRAQTMAHCFGITSWIDASVDDKILAAYRELERRGELTARVAMAYEADLEGGPEQVADVLKVQRATTGSRLRLTAVKIFADGVIEARTAAMLHPYVGGSDRGILHARPETLRTLVTAFENARIDVHVHAIGDRAIRETLNAFEWAHRQTGVRDARHTIAHLQLIDPTDIPRFKSLGVTANFQPLWAYADRYITDLTLPLLSEDRRRWIYPMQSLVASGARFAAGSDWSVSSLNPLEGIQVAVTRQGLQGKEPVFLPEQRVRLESVLAAYTREGAFLSRQENLTGTLRAGKAADLIVLDRDLFSVPPAEFHKVKVVMTLVAGRVVYDASSRARDGTTVKSVTCGSPR